MTHSLPSIDFVIRHFLLSFVVAFTVVNSPSLRNIINDILYEYIDVTSSNSKCCCYADGNVYLIIGCQFQNRSYTEIKNFPKCRFDRYVKRDVNNLINILKGHYKLILQHLIQMGKKRKGKKNYRMAEKEFIFVR